MVHAWRDGLATVFVAIGLVIYGAWVSGGDILGLESVEAVSLAVLGLGVAASASAVVTGWDELMAHGSRLYVFGASGLGGLALGAGLWAVFGRDPAGAAILVVATVALWAVSTARHLGLHVPALRAEHR
jgi:hypothetical protein